MMDMMNSTMNKRPVYSLNKLETKDAEGHSKIIIRAFENGFSDFESAKKALDDTLEVYKDYIVSYYNISFISDSNYEKGDYGYDIDFKKEVTS